MTLKMRKLTEMNTSTQTKRLNFLNNYEKYVLSMLFSSVRSHIEYHPINLTYNILDYRTTSWVSALLMMSVVDGKTPIGGHTTSACQLEIRVSDRVLKIFQLKSHCCNNVYSLVDHDARRFCAFLSLSSVGHILDFIFTKSWQSWWELKYVICTLTFLIIFLTTT